MQPTIRTLTLGLITTVLAALALAAPASATSSCSMGTYTKPFKPWLDYFNYAPVPGGNFESGIAGWRTSGTVKVVATNEPWRVGGADDASALSLAPGASATSPSFCGGVEYPTVRLFSKSSFALLSSLRVEVLYTGGDGILRAAPLGVVLPTSSWQPSPPIVTLSGLPLVTGSSLALRFTAVGATFTIDDVYVDPYSRN